MTIKNTNERYGDAVEFENVAAMENAIRACGYTLPEDGLQQGRDFEVVEDGSDYAVKAQYSETGYVEVAVSGADPFFESWVPFVLKNGEWREGQLHWSARPRVSEAERAEIEEEACDLARDWIRSATEDGLREAWYAVNDAAESAGHWLLGFKYSANFDSIEALYGLEDGRQETYVFDRDGYALEGETLGPDEPNDVYDKLDAERDGFQVTTYLERNWANWYAR